MTAATFPLIPRRRVLGLPFGALHSARRGLGSDVAGSRPYQPGDDIDRIDWYASARLSLARGSDEFVVREHFAEEAPRVVSLVDRRPSMSIFPEGWPWLQKPEAIRGAVRLISDSAIAARGLLGYLDEGEGDRSGTRPAASTSWGTPTSIGRSRQLPTRSPAASTISSRSAETSPEARSSSSSPTSSSGRAATTGCSRSSGGSRSCR